MDDKPKGKPNEQSLKKSNSKSVVDLYNKDLGTMGVPRDIAVMRPDQNFLFAGEQQTSVGQYEPKKIEKHSPSAMFGADTTKSRVSQK